MEGPPLDTAVLASLEHAEEISLGDLGFSDESLDLNASLDLDADESGPTAHKLSSHWTLWTNATLDSPKPTLTPLYDFDTVEEFWCIFNSLLLPSKIADRSDIIFMRNTTTPSEDGTFVLVRTKPEWESSANRTGGELRPQTKYSSSNLDKVWLYTLLGIIGGSMPNCESVNGIWFAMRHFGRVVLWQASLTQEHLLERQSSHDVFLKVSNSWSNLLTQRNLPPPAAAFTTHESSIQAVHNAAPPRKQYRNANNNH